MNKILILSIILFSTSFCQTTSLETTFDAQSVAMGESFAANPNSFYSFDENPAALIGTKGINILYNQRTINWFEALDDLIFYSYGASLESSFGNIAFAYKRFDLGEPLISTPQEPEGTGDKAKAYDHTFIISYANNLTKYFALGINLKTFSYVINGINTNIELPKSNSPFLVDFGLLYTCDGFYSNEVIKDNFNLGLSIQNYGTDYKETYSGRERYVKLPRYFNAGFAYQLNIPGPESLNDFNFLFTGEYKNHLNSIEEDRKDYWGIGIQATFKDIVSIRLGGIANPFTSIFGNKGVLNMRYGFGINIPIQLFYSKFPFTITFDYAVIPINAEGFIFSSDRKNLHAINIKIGYDKLFF